MYCAPSGSSNVYFPSITLVPSMYSPFFVFIGQRASTSVAAVPFVAHRNCEGWSTAREARQQSILPGSE